MDTSLKALVPRVCETYTFHGQLGLKKFSLAYCSATVDYDNPEVWSSNKVFAVDARNAEEFDLLFSELDDVFHHTSYLHFVVDPETPEQFVAELVLRDFEELEPTVQMVRVEGASSYKSSGLTLIAVKSSRDWDLLFALVLADHAEGARTQGSLSEEVSAGIVDGFKARSDTCQFFLAFLNDEPVAYGSAMLCTNNMGMVEDLFTLPAHRGQGIASAVIEHCVAHCESLGAKDYLIGSHVNQQPKKLYRRLGFQPICVTREYFKGDA